MARNAVRARATRQVDRRRHAGTAGRAGRRTRRQALLTSTYFTISRCATRLVRAPNHPRWRVSSDALARLRRACRIRRRVFLGIWGCLENRNGPYSSPPSISRANARGACRAGWCCFWWASAAPAACFSCRPHGPQRLTVEQSEQLHSELSAANLERQRLQSQLEETTQQRDANKTGHEKLTSDLAEARSKIDALNKELVLFQDAMPPDRAAATWHPLGHVRARPACSTSRCW